MSDAPSSQTPQSIGRYRIVRPLGSGAMGDVFLARDPHIDRELAIKTVRVLDGGAEDIEERTQRLLREARAAGKLLHPHVVTLFDADEVGGSLYLAFEYVPGTDLAQRARKPPPLSLREVLRTVREVASALDFAHGRNIVHRDIKPSNILIGTDGEAKVADFGIAKLKDQSTELTRTGSVVGSPQYMSPEQVRGEELDGRSDIFSLGVVLYEMLCRIRPFSGDTISTLVFQILAEEPTPIDRRRPGLEPRLASLVHRMLAKNRDERVASGSEVVQAVRELERVLPAATLDAPAALGPDQMPTQRIQSSGSVTPPSAEAFLGASAAQAPAPSSSSTSAPPPIPVPPGSPTTASQVAPTATMPGSGPPSMPPTAAPPAGRAAPPTVPPMPTAPPTGWDGSTLTPRADGAAKSGGGKILWIVAGLVLLLLAAGAGGWVISMLARDGAEDAPPQEEIVQQASNGADDPEPVVESASNDSSSEAGDDSTDSDSALDAPAAESESGPRQSPAPPGDQPPRQPPRRDPQPSEPPRQDPPPQQPATTPAPPPTIAPPSTPPPPTTTPAPPPPAPPTSPETTSPEPRTEPSARSADRLDPVRRPREGMAERRDDRREQRRTRLEERFDSDAASARQVLETGRSFRFDVEPDDTIVKFRRRGERSIVQGTVDEFEAGKRKKSDLELPGDGEYLIYLVREGYPDAIYHVKVESSRPGPTVIRQTMGGSS